MAGRVSLAQQIALLSETAPTDFDPEDINPKIAPSDDEEQEGTSTAARAHYIDVGPSTLRQMNQASISDPKYDSRRVSRKQLVDNEDQDEEIPSQDDASDEELPEGSESGGDEDEDEGEDQDRLHEEVHDEFSAPSRVRFVNPTPPSEVPSPRKPTKRSLEESEQPKGNQDLASTLRATRESDRKKGKAVTQQIALWDTLLDARIRLQKAASAVNTLPLVSQNLAEDPSVQDSLNAMLEEAIALSGDLFTLQDSLFRADGSIPPPKRAKLSHPSSSPRNYGADLTVLSATASTYETEYHAYLVPTLRKWSAKVQAVAPNVLLPAQRGSFKHAVNGRQGAASVVDVIDDTLRSDAEKLLARTRMSREHDNDDEGGDGEDEGLGKDGAEAFDDTDFYQQLLRDVIESRGANGEEGEQEWVRRQKARKAKRKKTVDTKASKGRKLRYQVHEKLQNFMVSIPISHGAWHEEQVDELFASLFSSGL